MASRRKSSDRRVIVPAAGRGVRFGGIPKELLPVSDSESCLGRAVALARQIGTPVVISNREKIALHRRHLGQVELKLQDRRRELWGAIRTGLVRDRAGALIMGDTVTEFSARQFPKPLMFGTFRTREAHRFSVIAGDRILTKKALEGEHDAWGVVVWSAEVTNFFLTLGALHYDRAFDAAMQRFGYGVFPLAYYHDLGTFMAYREFLNAAAARARR